MGLVWSPLCDQCLVMYQTEGYLSWFAKRKPVISGTEEMEVEP